MCRLLEMSDGEAMFCRGKYVCVVGEWDGDTGSPEFTMGLQENFTMENRVHLPNWSDTAHELTVWSRKARRKPQTKPPRSPVFTRVSSLILSENRPSFIGIICSLLPRPRTKDSDYCLPIVPGKMFVFFWWYFLIVSKQFYITSQQTHVNFNPFFGQVKIARVGLLAVKANML